MSLVDQLKAQIAELERCESMNVEWLEYNRAQQAWYQLTQPSRIKELLDLADVSRVDAERLNWLEQTEACDRWVVARMTALSHEPDGFVVYRHGNKERGEAKTLRAAIDAARLTKAVKKEG